MGDARRRRLQHRLQINVARQFPADLQQRGEFLRLPGDLQICLLAQGRIFETIQRIVNVHRHFGQQILHRHVERPRRIGIQGQHTNHLAFAMQGQGGGSSPSVGCTALVPRCGRLIMLEILAPDRMIFAQRDPGRTASCRFVRPDRDVDAVEVFHSGAEGSDRRHLAARFIQRTDPGHAHAAKMHRIAADLREQLRLVAAAHNGLVALAQRVIQLAHTLQFCVVLGQLPRAALDLPAQEKRKHGQCQ